MERWEMITPYLEVGVTKGSVFVTTDKRDYFDEVPRISEHPPVLYIRVLSYSSDEDERNTFLQTHIGYESLKKLRNLLSSVIDEHEAALEKAKKELNLILKPE